MKTTIDIADPLLEAAKKLAAEKHTTLKAILESALRQTLAAERRPRKRSRVQTRTFRGNGLQPGLSWDDCSAVRALTYEGRGG
jgi:hypothetical protein